MSEVGTTTTDSWGSGEFYVMFAGALLNTAAIDVSDLSAVVPSKATGFTSPSFAITGGAYDKADFATYHKFTYTAAYA